MTARLDPLARRMYRDYQRGLTLAEVAVKHCPERKYGLSRIAHLFKVRGLQCRPGPGPEAYKKIAATRRATLDANAAAMYADYLELKSCSAVAKKWKSDKGTVKYVLQRNGYTVRSIKQVPRQANGSPVRHVPFTKQQLAAMIAKATRFAVPNELKFEWRSWSLARRGEFIARLRAKFKRCWDRPEKPFSANVEPFDYASPRAHAIARKVNAGLDSRQHHTTIKVVCQGVIYQGQLWFWSAKAGYCLGSWLPEDGRPQLHRHIWEEHNGRKVPPAHVVRHVDGNWNNLDPENLTLATKNDICRENQSRALSAKSRAITALLLNRSQSQNPDAHTNTITALRAR